MLRRKFSQRRVLIRRRVQALNRLLRLLLFRYVCRSGSCSGRSMDFVASFRALHGHREAGRIQDQTLRCLERRHHLQLGESVGVGRLPAFGDGSIPNAFGKGPRRRDILERIRSRGEFERARFHKIANLQSNVRRAMVNKHSGSLQCLGKHGQGGFFACSRRFSGSLRSLPVHLVRPFN